MNDLPYNLRSAQSMYLEYVNDWLTIDAMAEHYGVSYETMLTAIIQGEEQNEKYKQDEKDN